MKYLLITLTLLLFIACAGPNPNPGERTADLAWHYGKYDKAISVIKPEAEEGIPWAQLRLCSAYIYGVGVEKNPNKAIKWCKKASVQFAEGKWADGLLVGAIGKAGFFNQNSDALIAQYQLANFYLNGDGTKKDLLTAYMYIRNVVEKTEGKDIFYCCEFAGGRHITAAQISDAYEKVTKEMSAEDLQLAEQQFPNWEPSAN